MLLSGLLCGGGGGGGGACVFRKSSLDFRCQTVWFRVRHRRQRPQEVCRIGGLILATLTTKNDRNKYTSIRHTASRPGHTICVNIYNPSALCVARHTVLWQNNFSLFI